MSWHLWNIWCALLVGLNKWYLSCPPSPGHRYNVHAVSWPLLNHGRRPKSSLRASHWRLSLKSLFIKVFHTPTINWWDLWHQAKSICYLDLTWSRPKHFIFDWSAFLSCRPYARNWIPGLFLLLSFLPCISSTLRPQVRALTWA